MTNRTSFVIAHRLNTNKGEIVEMGTHADLIERQRRYFNFYTIQRATQQGHSSFSEN